MDSIVVKRGKRQVVPARNIQLKIEEQRYGCYSSKIR